MLKEQVLMSLYRRIRASPKKNVSVWDVGIEFELEPEDAFRAAISELVQVRLLIDRGHGTDRKQPPARLNAGLGISS